MSDDVVLDKPWRSELRKADEQVHDLVADLLATHHSTQDWAMDALCAQTDPGLFFPELGQNPNQAKQVCAKCPVVSECLDFAVTHGIRHGVWGGLSVVERRNLDRTDLAG